MFNEETKIEILKDIRPNFAGFKGGINDTKLNDMLNTYEKFIAYPDEHEDFAEYHTVDKIINAYYLEGAINETFLEPALTKFLNFEPFLRKLYYMIDKNAYTKGPVKEIMAGSLLVKLGLYEVKENSHGSSYIDAVTLHEHFQDTAMEECLRQAYDVRNDIAHKWSSFGRRERSEYIANVLSVCIYICYKYQEHILNKCTVLQQINIDLPGICKDFVKDYEQNVRNGFRYVPMRWLNEKTGEPLGRDLNPLKDPKSGALRIQFSGEAGCGKTTLARYLAYEDASKYLKYIRHEKDAAADIPKIPIFIELKNIKIQVGIIEYISKFLLKCSEEETLSRLASGMFILYLDGVNEMINERTIKHDFTLSVQRLLRSCPKLSVVITDRDQIDYNLREHVCIYRPSQPMLPEILEFTRIVTETEENPDEIYEKINSWLETHPDYYVHLNTPLKINRLIKIVACGGELPDNPQEFIHAYVTTLLDRERNEKMDYMAEPGRLDSVLQYVAQRFRHAEDQMPLRQYYIFCANAIKEFALNMDSVDCGKLAIQLGFINVHVDDQVSFSDVHLYDYFKNLV